MKSNSMIKKIVKRYETLSVVLSGLMFLALVIFSPYFFGPVNIETLQVSVAPEGIIALSMMILLMMGTFDLSVGSVMCLGGLVSAICLSVSMPIIVAVILGIVAGSVIGAINGLLIVYAKINALITTIGTMYITRGVCDLILVGRGIGAYGNFPEEFLNLGGGKLFGVYYMFWIFIVLAVIMALYIKYIPSGRKLLFIGGNENAAALMGIKISKIKMISFILCGTLAAFAGMLLTARSTAANRYMGQGSHMNVIIACIIGGGSLSGGQGSMIGAVFGTVFMAFLMNSFNLFEISSQWQNITTGIVLLVVVLSDGYASIRKQKALGII